jgi:hypothetical protein
LGYLSVAREHAGAVLIPLAELEQRTHELPPPERLVCVIADSLGAYYALGWLHARGRRALLIPIAWSEFTNRVYSCLPYTQEDYLCADENS